MGESWNTKINYALNNNTFLFLYDLNIRDARTSTSLKLVLKSELGPMIRKERERKLHIRQQKKSNDQELYSIILCNKCNLSILRNRLHMLL